jgi:transcriptional regulator with XRE-family HTH domain
MSRLMKVVRVVDVPGLGARIKEAREALDRPLTEVAYLAGMSTANWYRIEKEETKELPEATLRRIEAALGVSFSVSFE